MNLSTEKFTIRLPKPFRIAHGLSHYRDTILVRLHDSASGLTGRGEGALPPYYPSTAEACLAWLESLSGNFGGNFDGSTSGSFVADQASHSQGILRDPSNSLAADLRAFPNPPPTVAAAVAALDIACHDLQAQRAGVPLWRLWGG